MYDIQIPTPKHWNIQFLWDQSIPALMQAGDNYDEVRTNLVTGIRKLQESMAERLQVASKQSTWTRAWCCSCTLCGFAQNIAILQNGMRFEPISGFGTSSRGRVWEGPEDNSQGQGRVWGKFRTGSDMVLIRCQIRSNVLSQVRDITSLFVWNQVLSACYFLSNFNFNVICSNDVSQDPWELRMEMLLFFNKSKPLLWSLISKKCSN